MARYTGADCRRCRREKMKLFLKGSKCESPKCPIEIRPYPPGEHGRGRTKDSEYLLQKREKQKCARIYGVLEKQFRGYYEEANKKTGKTGENLLIILESRLDNVVYRAGFAPSRAAARQLVNHGHFAVNGVPTDVASYQLKPGDRIEVREIRRSREPFKVVKETLRNHQAPEWLSLDAANLSATVANPPSRDQMPLDLNEQLVVEYYSR